jgi:hypothetical protein
VRSPIAGVLGVAILGALCVAGPLLLGAPSGASGTVFCRSALAVTSVPSPALPSSDSLDAITAALSKLPGDLATLKRERGELAAAAAGAPNATLAAIYRVAASAAGSESADLERVENEAAVVLLDPESSAGIAALANDVIAAAKDAATVDAYLDVDRSQVASACR